MTTPLQQAAQAVITRWNSQAWKDQPHTAHYIEELRKALDAELAQSVEPAAWAMCRADGLVLDVICPDEHESYESYEGFYTTPLYLHPPQPQATTPAVRECWYESNELKVCRKCGQMHDKAIAAQGEKP